MKLSLRTFVAGALLMVMLAPALVAGTRKCPNSPAECEREIRQMLEGKPGPLGFAVRSVTGGKGIVVESVTPDSAADKAGLMAGDRVMSIDRYDVSKATLTELRRIREKILVSREKEPSSRKIVITVNRVGTFRRLTLRVEKMTKEQIDQIVAAHLKEAHGVDSPSQKAGSGTDGQ